MLSRSRQSSVFHTIQNPLQSYEKKMTFANFCEEKLHIYAFFVTVLPFVLAQGRERWHKKEKRSFNFSTQNDCLNVLHCLAVISEGTRPKGRGVPNLRKIFEICKNRDKKMQNFFTRRKPSSERRVNICISARKNKVKNFFKNTCKCRKIIVILHSQITPCI